MRDQTPEEVATQLAALGLAAQDPEDLEEVTHRINAIREALGKLELPLLDAQESLTAPWPGETPSWQ